MPKFYPTRRYKTPAEVRAGDAVRMRHDDETHGSYSPAFDDCIVVAINVDDVELARPMSWLRGGEVHTTCERFTVSLAGLVERFHVLTTGLSGEVDSRLSEHQWSVRFVHKISPSPADTRPPVTLPTGALNDVRTLGAALREVGLLDKGERLRDYRIENECVVAFPQRSIWHSIILTWVAEPKRMPE